MDAEAAKALGAGLDRPGRAQETKRRGGRQAALAASEPVSDTVVPIVFGAGSGVRE